MNLIIIKEKIPEEWKSENLGKVDKSSIFGASSMFSNCDYSSNEFCVFDENSEGKCHQI